MLQHCLCLSWLWSLLTAGLASSTLNAITPQAVEASAQDRAPAFDYSRQQQTLPLAQRAPLTPTRTSKENEALVGPNRRSSTVGLDRSSVASLPRAGAIGNRKGKVNGMLDRVRNKRNELPSPGSELQKAVAVNAASWAAVVGGVVLWSRTKMGSEEGNDMFAAAAWSPALSGTAAAVVHIVHGRSSKRTQPHLFSTMYQTSAHWEKYSKQYWVSKTRSKQSHQSIEESDEKADREGKGGKEGTQHR